jgi:hypothetical protein
MTWARATGEEEYSATMAQIGRHTCWYGARTARGSFALALSSYSGARAGEWKLTGERVVCTWLVITMGDSWKKIDVLIDLNRNEKIGSLYMRFSLISWWHYFQFCLRSRWKFDENIRVLCVIFFNLYFIIESINNNESMRIKYRINDSIHIRDRINGSIRSFKR